MSFYDIPLNADKMLFAEDLIHWYMTDRWPTICRDNLKTTDISNSSVVRYREFIYNGFDRTIKLAVDFIDDCLEHIVFADFVVMRNEDRLTNESFIEYADIHHSQYFSYSGFQATLFLEYCTRLTNLGGYFYINNKRDILPVVVESIVKGFPDGDMFSGGWDTLKIAAQTFVKQKWDFSRELTPSDSESSFSTDSLDSNADEDYLPSDFDSSEIDENLDNEM